MKNKKKEDSNN